MRIHRAAGVALALLAATAVAVAAGPGPRSDAGAQRAAKAHRAIAISGNVAGLYPGAVKSIRLRIRNRSPRARTVTSVRGRVIDAGPGCSARNLKTKRKRVRIRIPGRSLHRIKYRIRMIRDAADACRRARFPIRYRARVR